MSVKSSKMSNQKKEKNDSQIKKKEKPLKEEGTSKDSLNPDKRFKREYSKELVKYVNSAVRREELDIFKELYNAVREDNKINSPQDLMLLDMAIYDYLRAKRVQKILNEQGLTIRIPLKGGGHYEKVHEANYLLNSIETQFRNLMKEIGITGKEKIKKSLGAEAQDFSNFMASTVVEAEVVENENK